MGSEMCIRVRSINDDLVGIKQGNLHLDFPVEEIDEMYDYCKENALCMVAWVLTPVFQLSDIIK